MGHPCGQRKQETTIANRGAADGASQPRQAMHGCKRATRPEPHLLAHPQASCVRPAICCRVLQDSRPRPARVEVGGVTGGSQRLRWGRGSLGGGAGEKRETRNDGKGYIKPANPSCKSGERLRCALPGVLCNPDAHLARGASRALKAQRRPHAVHNTKLRSGRGVDGARRGRRCGAWRALAPSTRPGPEARRDTKAGRVMHKPRSRAN